MHIVKKALIIVLIVFLIFGISDICLALGNGSTTGVTEGLINRHYIQFLGSCTWPSNLYFVDIEPFDPTSQHPYGKCGGPYNYLCEEPPPNEVAEPLKGRELYIFYIAQICEQYYPDVDPYIVMAIMETESNYQPNVQSPAGAVGLMQVIPKYHLRRAEPYGLNDIWDPYTNILCAIDLLNDLYHAYGSWEQGLLGYNNSASYVRYVLSKADVLRGGNYFGETASPDTGGS